jgi:hypothetical protein
MIRAALGVAFFLAVCPLHRAAGAAAIPGATPAQVHQTVDRAIGYLQAESGGWLATRHCAACHHAGMPLWAMGEARRQGYAVNSSFMEKTFESLLGGRDKLMASRIFPDPSGPIDPRPQARGLNMGLAFLAVAAESLPSPSAAQKQSLQLIEDEIVKKQQPDGAWEFFPALRRPPINQSQLTDAAWNIMALQGEIGPDTPLAHRAALSKATAWFDAAKPTADQQEVALKLLVALRAGESPKAVRASIDQLLALQRPDGGWSQSIPEPRSDAFATGQSLYVLSRAGLTAERPEIRRGIDFIVATQNPDGRWPMVSRATPDGSPGGAKNLSPITCAAASWALLGLAEVSPQR